MWTWIPLGYRLSSTLGYNLGTTLDILEITLGKLYDTFWEILKKPFGANFKTIFGQLRDNFEMILGQISCSLMTTLGKL